MRRPAIAVLAGLAVGLLTAAPVQADPGDNPCDLAVNFLCRFVPIAPADFNLLLAEAQWP